jgi:hypothetical protein
MSCLLHIRKGDELLGSLCDVSHRNIIILWKKVAILRFNAMNITVHVKLNITFTVTCYGSVLPRPKLLRTKQFQQQIQNSIQHSVMTQSILFTFVNST